MIKAGEHYLIPCNKLALRTIMVKMGAKTKLQVISLEFFHVFIYFEILKTVVKWTLNSNVVLFEK